MSLPVQEVTARPWRAVPWRSLVVAAAVVTVASAPGAPSMLAWDRSAIAAGQVWRLCSGHLVHASGYHLIWNVLPLLALGVLWERVLGRRFWSVLALSAVLIGVGLYALEPDLARYVGLSGVLNGMWVGGALVAARRDRERRDVAGSALCLGFVAAGLAKIAVEAWSGAPLFTNEAALGARAVPLAHALGSLGGALAAAPRPSLARPGRDPRVEAGGGRWTSPVPRPVSR